MKTSKYLEDLRTQSAEELNAQLVEAKKELFNIKNGKYERSKFPS